MGGLKPRVCHWYAVHVRSRHEYKIEKDLLQKGVEVFLPLVNLRRKWTDRTKLVSFPLFPGYIFVHIDENSTHKKTVLQSPGVTRYVCMCPGEPTPVPETQIDSLKRAIETGAPLDPYPYLKEGRRVRIRRGPLAGIEGILVKKEENSLLVLSVDILQQGAALKIEAGEVEAV